MKNIWKRFLSLVLCVCMVWSLLPNVTMTAFAASSGEVTGLSNENIGLSYSGDKTDTWTASGTTVTGSIQSSSGCGTTHYSSTLTLTNRRSIPAVLSFDYAIDAQGGTIQVDGTAVTAGGTFSKELAAGGTVSVYIKSNSTSAPTKVTLSNLALSANVQATTTFLPAENGTYTVNGVAVTEEYSNTQNATNAYKLAAVPNEGYQFRGWYNVTTGEYLGTDTKLTLNVESDCTITAQFIAEDANLFEVGTQTYEDLGEAVAYAQEKSISKVTLLSKKATLTKACTIPAGVTLLVPHDAAKTLLTTTPTALTPGKQAATKKNEFKSLTLAEGVTLTVEGSLSVGGQYLSASGGSNSYMSGDYGQVWLNAGSNITVKSGGNLYAWGFVSGAGTVTVKSGGNVYEWYQILDFRGGSATMGIGNKVFPFSQYDIQNVESAMTLEHGATEYAYAAVYASSRINASTIPFIGDNGMFKIVSGSLTKMYDGTTDRILYTVNGEAEVNNLELKLAGSTVNSEKYVLPITNNMTINLAEGSKLTVNQTAALLPGVQANIASGANLVIANGVAVYAYDQDEWGGYCDTYSLKFKAVGYAPSKAYNRTENDLVDARLNVNGTLTVNGALYTTESGANICSGAGTGVYKQEGAIGKEKVTYQYTQSGSKVTAHEIPITPAKLCNADGTYVETANAVAGDAWSYESGKWTLNAVPRCTVTFAANDGTDQTSTQEIVTGIPTPLEGNPFTYEGYTFTGWNTEADGTGESYADKAEVTLSEDITLYAQWKIKTFTVIWKNGTTELYTEQVEYGKIPEYAGETPTKAATVQYTYTFKGWSPEPAPIKADTTYEAQFDRTVNKYPITWYDEDGVTVLATSDVEYGTVPAYPYGEPTKAGNTEITYAFNGWTPELTEVTAAASYTATFRAVNNRTVIWVNWDGTELDRARVTAEQTPEYTGATPAREGNAEYAYTFSGWEPVQGANDSDMIYKAVFEKTQRSYTVTWLDENGAVLSTDTALYGAFPIAPEMAAEKTVTETVEVPATEGMDAETEEADQTLTTEEVSITYYFTGWTPVLTRVTGNVSYQAVYAAEAPTETHTVTWVNYDGTELATASDVKAGETVSYSGETPAKNADEHYSYTFSGWDAAEDQNGNIVYTATYTANGIPSTITWKYEDGTVLKSESVPYGELPVYSGAVPTKAPEGDRKFVFAGWSPDVTAVTGDAAYTAVFDKVLKRYTINWVNWDDTVLAVSTVTEGETPAYTGETPIRPADVQYTYTFSGWTPAVGPAMADETYKAVFTSEAVKYTVSWYDEDGTTLLEETQVPYGEVPTYPVMPEKAEDDDFIYTFAGWDPEPTSVTGDASYKAVFNKTAKLTVTWKNGDTVLKTEKVAPGTVPEYTGEAPVKEDDEKYSYTFTGWDPEPAAVTEDTVFTAVFEQTLHKYTITWVNYDGTVLDEQKVLQDEMPAYTGSAPTKPYDNDYSYEFSGWTPELTAATEDKTYTAQFTAVAFVKHTVFFDANGGEGTMEPQVFRVGVSETLSPNVFTWEYHEFLGWNTEADGSGATYDNEGALIDLDADITLYAQWKELEKPIEPITAYSDFLSCLKELEIYASQYALEHPGEDSVALVINYIRTGVAKYTSSSWSTFCGPENTAFVNYVAAQEGSREGAQRLRELREFSLPNGDAVDFAHMFGCMDMAYHSGIQKTADLGSWAGDICDLVQLTTNAGVTGTVEEMAEEIRTNNDKYFLYDDPDAHSFGRLDLYGDLDAFYILKKLPEGRSISAIMESYFNVNLTESVRAKFFLNNRFGSVSTKSEIRTIILDTYLDNDGVLTLEKSYVPGGVNEDLRKACCYAFADYLYGLAKDQIENPYYTVFSSTESKLAPGVTQETNMAITQDGKQIVYYIASADISRSDVSVYANYGLNDASSWRMTRVTEQMKAAEANHSDPESDRYIPNYSAVVGINGDFYNMTNGAPSGALVMEGVEYHGFAGRADENFFGILKDGTPIIGGAEEWAANKDNIQEAIGASICLVKDGKIAVTEDSNYYNSRVSRTCVGITNDGRVIFMVLDGRQEPFSAGGAAIEAARIMQDAGCISAVNLDGGGSTTLATKAEGAETIAVANRPSDGYERSVSSSLMIVSTAKPSNVFDHAVISTDYDYLTVGTSMNVSVSGVTATGGAAAIPENSELKVSDDQVGTLTEGVFTASAQGEVQIQLVSEDGTVLGSKTLNVVEPTDLRFTKSSINVVYGEASTLPLEASYNGNPVKINSGDVVFGYVKVSLASIVVNGETVMANRNELVYDYPEAGTIEGFDFTANEAGGLRNLTIGAILKNKTDAFNESYSTEYQKAYNEAIAGNATEEQARIQAQNAALSKALGEAAQTTAYMYKSSEAEFDFSTAYGDGILSWKRSVPNSTYKDDTATYYLKGRQAEIDYTFAVDMSKIAIPEKLTKLLYMLPGGDQEGRTAWDFMLQLAERISPLTTVTITMKVPEGFTVDTTGLRLANELFTLTSSEVKDGVLSVVCNYIAQSEPINPATVNPLCVLSGLKLVAQDGAWPLDGSDLECFATGDLNYDIYAHFHILESLAQKEDFQKEYGLYPYNNTANIPGDSGAHFMDTVAQYEDRCYLHRDSAAARSGWYREDGSWSYYVDGTALTGVQELPSHIADESGKFWYDLGEDGKCGGKLTGLFEKDGSGYYARLGVLATGWQSIADADGNSYFYYFDKTNGKMLTGYTEADVKGLFYTFDENGKLVRGAFRTDARGTKYFVAGESWFRRFVTLEEGTYWIERNGYIAYGNAPTVLDNVMDYTWYHFDEKTGIMTGPCSGFVTYNGTMDEFGPGSLYYVDKNGKPFYGAIKVDDGIIFTATAGLVYRNRSCYISDTTEQRGCSLGTGTYWCGEDGYIVGNGFADIDGATYYYSDYVIAKGFTKIGDDYYLFNSGNGKMAKDATMWVPANSYGVEPGMHYFRPDGKMFVPDLENGVKKIVNENGKLYFTIDGVKMTNGLNELDGEYYYAQTNGELVVGRTAWVSQKNDLIPEKGNWYVFDEAGRLQKTGFVTDTDGYVYYYDDCVLALGFTRIGEDYYFFNAGSGKMYKDTTLWVGSNSYGVEPGMHYFQPDGKMFVPNLETGVKKIVNENGKLYFTIDGVKMTNGLNELDGEYYYAQTNGELVVGRTAWVSQKNDLIPEKGNWYVFDEAGRLQKTGFVTDTDGYVYYYDDCVLALGFTKIGEDYYFFNAGSGKMYKDTSLWVGSNSYGVEPGMHAFLSDGKMLVPGSETGVKKIVNENGKLYLMIDGVKMTNGLNELDGEYYYAQPNGCLVVNATIWVSQKNGLIPEKGDWHSFDTEGKLIKTGFVTGGGDTYYYENNVLALGFTKIGTDYYFFNAGSGKMYKDTTLWVGSNSYGVTGGMYRFDTDGKMVQA